MYFVIDYQLNTQELRSIVEAIQQPERMMHKVGERLLWLNQDRHNQELDPDGVKWLPLAPLTLGNEIWKHKENASHRKNGSMSLKVSRTVRMSRKILYGRGDMLDSFNYSASGSEVVLGFSDAKAKWHHFGTGTHGDRGTPYIIRPKDKKALAFAGLVVKQVEHPGVPARRLIGFPASDELAVRQVMDDYLLSVLKRAR